MKLDPSLVRAARPFLSGERDTFATVLLSILLRAYGAQVLNWEPETLEMEIRHDFSVDVPDPQMHQILGLSTILTSDTFYNAVEAFDRCTSALVLAPTDDEHDAPTVEELAWAVAEASLADPEHAGQFSLNIRLYIGCVLKDEGFRAPPKSLEWAAMSGQIAGTTDNFETAYQSRTAEADAVDQWVADRIKLMAEHLAELGIKVDMAALRQELQTLEAD